MKKLFSFLLIVVLIACSKDPVIYTLTATANPSEGGTVSPSSQQYDSDEMPLHNLLPYFYDGRLHFVGAFITNYDNKELTLYDFKLKIQN